VQALGQALRTAWELASAPGQHVEQAWATELRVELALDQLVALERLVSLDQLVALDW
jgi:hypothetical protein